MTYEKLIGFLQDKHFYPNIERQVGTKSSKIIGLQVASAPIMMESKKIKLEEILGDKYRVQTMKNEGYLLITKKK